jgi:hypothetical protein
VSSIGPIHIFQHKNNTNAVTTFKNNVVVVVRYDVLYRLNIHLCVELGKVPREEVVKGRYRKKKPGLCVIDVLYFKRQKIFFIKGFMFFYYIYLSDVILAISQI